MSASLSDLQTLRTVLGRLNAERPALMRSGEGQTTYEERGVELLERLALEVTSRRGKARVLVTGQIGVGKSSELWRFFEKCRQDKLGFPIFCDLEKQEHPERCGATGVLLTIFRDCWASTAKLRRDRDRLSRLRDAILSRLIDWLKGEYTSEQDRVVFRFGGMDFSLYLHNSRKDRALATLLGKAAQHEAVSQPSERFGLMPDSLIHHLNDLLQWIAQQNQGPPVLIVDHVDKIRDANAAEDVLMKAVPQWSSIQASIVMTAPLEYTLGTHRNSVESRWGRPLVVYPAELADEGSPLPTIYERIAKTSGVWHLATRESIHLLAHYSGGVLRLYVQFLIEACKEAYIARHHQIALSDAWSVVHGAERSYQDYGVKELALLDSIWQSGTGLGEAAILLRSPIGLLIAEPVGGQQKLRVHPLVRTALERYQGSKKVAG